MDNNTSRPETKNSGTAKTVAIVILVLIVVGLLARYVIFKDRFEEFSAGLERIEQWQTDYKQTHPNASKEEMDAEFRTGIDNLKKWKDNYKAAHPGATDADADAEFNRLWNK